jgi:hypothetical protein
MILSAHQPAYLPWLGYFDKILKSDVFIFLDSVQFEKNSFSNRNKIKTPQGAIWLTVPVRTKGHLHLSMTETGIDNTNDWRKNHLKSIFLNYKKAPRFEECYSKLEALYQKEYPFLADLCWDHLMFWLAEMKVMKKIVRSSQLALTGKKSELIEELCKDFRAAHYLSGALGKQYLNEERFSEAGITIEYQQYEHPVYEQLWGDFLPNLSIVDFWMNSSDYRLLTGERNEGLLDRMG